MKLNATRKILSALLACILTFSSLPISVIAENIAIKQETNENTFEESLATDEDVFIVQEDTTKRGEFEKHYICSDGTYVVASYAEAIHYKDDNGNWIDVDNRPMQTTEGAYATRNGDFGISVPSSTSDGHLMRMNKGEHSLSWTLSANKMAGTMKMDSNVSTMAQKPAQSQKMQVGTTKRPEIIISNTEQPHEKHKVLRDEATFDLPNVSGKVRYDNLFGADEGVSVVYTTYRNKIEEDIYIEKPTDITSFSMEVEAPDLIPRLNADNSVDFLDNDGKMCYHVGIPYMMDADFAVLNDIETSVTRSGDTWVITYTPDAEWFTSEERAYPILLDPSITTNDYVSNIEDTYVEENSTTNHIDEQYLYITANGNNKRNAVVRITKLPVIDESMPIISAKLTLTAQYAPFSDVALKAGYCDTTLDLDEYDYYLTSINSSTYIAYSYLVVGSRTVTFDVTSHIYEMYDDEEFDKEYGYDYHGDFIIGYATSGDTTFTYPFFSADYATPASRPVFTVKYGYTLPAGILDGEVYSFKNCGSYSYMTVNGAEPANNSNVYQVWNDNDIATTTQKFKLEYVSSTGGYLLRSMASSSGNGKVLDIRRAGGAIYSGRNVQIYAATDPISQEWLIIPVNYNTFRIVPRANMELTLTAYGNSDGTNSGKTSTSPGNIFVQTFVEGNSYQKWCIYNNSNKQVNALKSRAVIETGNYYISSSYIGKYLHRTNNVANCLRTKINDAGENTVKWKIVNLGDGYCTIGRSDLPGYYLAPTSSSSGSGVRIVKNLSETIPDNCKWSITIASGGGCLIQNKESGYYLYALNQSANPSSVCLYSLYSVGSDGYKKQTWRIADEDYYVELGIATSFNNIAIDINESKVASINKNPGNAKWATYTDFDYTIVSGSQYVSYNASTHKFTGLSYGTAQVRATHKVTGISKNFEIKIYRSYLVVSSHIQNLYSAALTYDNLPKNALMLTLQFIRSGRYNDDLWDTVAGDINMDFVEYIENNYPQLFSELMIYPNDNYYFVDPSEMGDIDFVHMCATLNGLLYDSTGFKSAVAGEDNIDNLCGWAGDLQTLCIDILKYTDNSNNYDTIYNATLLLLGNQDSSVTNFSMSDLLADVDAYNLYNDINSDRSNFIIAFNNYYSSQYNMRFTDFTNSWSKQRIYDCVRCYTTNTFFLGVDWPLLEGYEITSTQSDAIAQAFTNYIWEPLKIPPSLAIISKI